MFRLSESYKRLMRGFKNLFEARPPTEAEIKKAYDIFSLKPGDDLSGLDKLWKELARKNHPDLGGDPEKMKDINWAKDILSNYGYGFRSGSSGRVDWEAIKQRNEKNGEINKALLEKLVKMLEAEKSTYSKYFDQFLKGLEPKSFVYSKKDPEYQGVYGASGVWSWETSDKSTVISLRVSVQYQTSTASLGSASDEFTVEIVTDLFRNGKKYKIGRRDYQGKKLSSDLLDPKEIFPSKAMKRLSTETRADSKMKRSDFESSLVHLFGAQKPGDWWYLPIDDTKAFALRRGVMNRLPFWQVLGIKGKTPIGWSQNLKDNFRSISMYENMKTIELLKNVMSLLKDGKQKEAEDQINSYDYEKML